MNILYHIPRPIVKGSGRLVRQGFGGEANEQVAIRSASGGAQQGEGEDEGFGVEDGQQG